MNEDKRFFEKGDFVTNPNKPGSFAIFEGIECESYSSLKKYSAIAAYDPSKFQEITKGNWETLPYLEVATKTTRCSTKIDGDAPSYWFRLCTEKEKENALNVLQDYGYYWNEDLLSIISKDTGEIIRTIADPKIEYNGNVIKPISRKLKDMLKNVCDSIIKKKYSYNSETYYSCYGGFWDGEIWD